MRDDLIDLRSAIIIDQHAHSLVEDFMQFEAVDLRRCFTESRTMDMLQNHVGSSISYIDMIRKLGDLLDVDGESQVIELRQTMKEYDYVNGLFDDVSLGAFIIDDGYSSGRAMPLQKLSQLTGRPVFRCLRIESVIEHALSMSSTFGELEEKFLSSLSAPSEVPTVALKTILAYRGGLNFLDATKELAQEDFSGLKKSSKPKSKSESESTSESTFDQTQNIRIERCNLHHYLLLRAFEFAGEKKLPVQIHTGMGDSDEDLLESNPILLKKVFENKHYSSVKFVLLHCYPFVREAAYLASLYSNVYMDLSLACFLVSANFESIMSEAISLAPVSKILTGTDGHTAPETHWYGAYTIKRSLSSILSRLVRDDFMDETTAVKLAGDILHGNARRLYRLEGLA